MVVRPGYSGETHEPRNNKNKNLQNLFVGRVGLLTVDSL